MLASRVSPVGLSNFAGGFFTCGRVRHSSLQASRNFLHLTATTTRTEDGFPRSLNCLESFTTIDLPLGIVWRMDG